MKNLTMFVLITLLSTSSSYFSLHAKEQSSTSDDSSNEDNRLKITDWLSVQAEVELSQEQVRQIISNGSRSKIDEFSESLDIEVFLEASNILKGKIALEYDDENGGFLIDEAITILELNKSEIKLGKTKLPFGDYSTNFINDAPISFAEIQGKGIVLSNKYKDNLALSLFAYKGDATKTNSSNNSIDWGITTEFSPNESWTFGVGYISDLADAEDLEFNENRYEKRVSGISVFSYFEFSDIDIKAEYTSALGKFREFEDYRNKPKAWNLEVSHEISDKMEWSLRYASSNELEEEPHRQYGVSGTWHFNNKLALNVEYLVSDYKNDPNEDIQERNLSKSKGITVQLKMSF